MFRSAAAYSVLLATLALALSTACSGGAGTDSGAWSDDDDGSGGGGGGGDYGATPGGVKDMSFARALVEQGVVPPPEAFLVEAMFSEHDLPLTSDAECSTLFCTKAAMGIAPDEAGASHAWLQVGLSSTINPETFQRPSLDLVFVVDVSGSMSWDYPNGANGGNTATALLQSMTAQLGIGDRVAIVAFDDVSHDVLPLTPAVDQTAIGSAITELRSTGGGGTSIEAGLQRGFEVAMAIEGSADVRIVLVTDAQPNVGATQPAQFETLIAAGADAGVPTTVFGIGLGLSQQVMNAMAAERGGNAFTVMAEADVPVLMEQSWPWMFCPIAYDLTLAARPSENGQILEAYGFPGDTDPDEVSRTSKTIFLSRKKGALLLELAPAAAGPIAAMSAAVTVDFTDLDGFAVHHELSASYSGQALDAGGRYFPQIGVENATALALLVTAMHDSATIYAADQTGAVARLQAARDRLASDIAATSDAEIDAELAFTDALLALMQNGATQGSLYP